MYLILSWSSEYVLDSQLSSQKLSKDGKVVLASSRSTKDKRGSLVLTLMLESIVLQLLPLEDFLSSVSKGNLVPVEVATVLCHIFITNSQALSVHRGVGIYSCTCQSGHSIVSYLHHLQLSCSSPWGIEDLVPVKVVTVLCQIYMYSQALSVSGEVITGLCHIFITYSQALSVPEGVRMYSCTWVSGHRFMSYLQHQQSSSFCLWGSGHSIIRSQLIANGSIMSRKPKTPFCTLTNIGHANYCISNTPQGTKKDRWLIFACTRTRYKL